MKVLGHEIESLSLWKQIVECHDDNDQAIALTSDEWAHASYWYVLLKEQIVIDVDDLPRKVRMWLSNKATFEQVRRRAEARNITADVAAERLGLELNA